MRLISLLAVCLCIVAADSTERQVSVRVVAPGDSKAVANLRVSDFELTHNGERRELVSAQDATLPLDLMFIVERRRWDPPDSLVVAALESVQVRLTAEDRVGLIVVDHRLKTVLPAGSSAVEFAHVLTRPTAGLGGRILFPLPRPLPTSEKGPTLLDAVASAAQDLRKLDRAGRQRVIVVIAPDKDRSSRTPLARAIELAVSASAIVSVITLPEEPLLDQRDPGPRVPPSYPPGISQPQPRRPLPPLSGSSLQPLVRATGGESREGGGPTTVEMVERLGRQYSLSYRSSASDEGDVTVKLSKKALIGRPHAVVLLVP